MKIRRLHLALLLSGLMLLAAAIANAQQPGEELSSYERLENGQEFDVSIAELLRRGEAAF